MFETVGYLNEEVLEEIARYRKPLYQKIMIWVIFAAGIVYLAAALTETDYFGAVMGLLMALLGANSLFHLPYKWKHGQLAYLRSAGEKGLRYRVSYGEDAIHMVNETANTSVDVRYGILYKGLETDTLIVLFDRRGQYVLSFKKALGYGATEQLKEFLGRKLPKRFRWTRHLSR